MIKKTIVLFIILFISCKNEKDQLNSIQKNNCKTIKISKDEVFNKLNFTVENLKYMCDSLKDNTFTKEYQCQKNIGKYFSDKNFSFYVYDDNTRLVYDKNEKLWIAIKASGFENFNISNNQNRFISIFLLDENLIPFALISRFKIFIFKDDFKNKKLKQYSITIEKAKNFNLNRTNYNFVLHIKNEIKKNNFKTNNEVKSNMYLDEFYKDSPLWTVLYH